MVGFRFVAMGYALLVFLIAPSWLAAEEEPAPSAVDETVTTVQESVPDVPDLPLTAPVTNAGEADGPDSEPTPDREEKADREPTAAPAKTDERKRDKEPSAKASASATVTISDFKYTPSTVTVNEGDTVTFSNDGPTVHTATADDGSFDTGSLRKGESGSATFTSAGTVTFYCQPHPFMKGKVVVQAASAGGSSGSGSTGTSGTGSTENSGSSGAVAGDDSSSGSGLPNTGSDALSLALLGVATLGLGLLMRRRRAT